MIGTLRIASGSAIRWSVRLLEQAVAPEQQIAPHLQADQAVEIAAAHPERRQLAKFGHDDDVAIAELHRDRIDRFPRLDRRGHDRGFDPAAVFGAVGDRAQYRQVLKPRRRPEILAVAVVEEGDRPQPQFRRLLQDADHLPPDRAGTDHHGRHAPQSEPDQHGPDDALSQKRQHDAEQDHRHGGAERPEKPVSGVGPGVQQREQHAGRLDAHGKPLDRRLAVHPVHVQQPVDEGQRQGHHGRMRADRERLRPLAGRGPDSSRPRNGTRARAAKQSAATSESSMVIRPDRAQEAMPDLEPARRLEALQGTAVRRDRGLFISERHSGAPSTGSVAARSSSHPPRPLP